VKYSLLSFINDAWYFHIRRPAGYILYLLANILSAIGAKQRSLKLCMRSARYANRAATNKLLKSLLRDTSINKKLVSSGVDIRHAAQRSIILRWPVFENEICVSKGILVVTFTKTFSFFIRDINADLLNQYFYLVLEPSWSGYADPDIIGLFNKHHPPIIQSSEIEDRILLNSFQEYCIPVSFGASDWVDYNLFKPMNSVKIYDSIYIANTNPIKRIQRYIKAVKWIVDNRDPQYKACLVCASWGGAESLISGFVKRYKLESNLTLRFSLSREQVIEFLNASKVNVLLSLKEGSNRSLFEALFCNTPVILAYENVGVNKSYINENTGLLLDNNALEEGLIWIKQNFDKFNTREWALDNISPVATTQKLASLLRARFDEKFNDILIKTNNPEVSYLEYPAIAHDQYTLEVLQLFVSSSSIPISLINNRLCEIKKLFGQEINNTNSR
jgi:glycosyltransferase involved in cell wall biosynthesis